MAKVAMMTDGLRRKPTYEEVIDHIENDPDKIKYPERASKFLRNTFQLSQLDGMGHALLEQQQAEEMKERAKYYQLHQLAVQNDTDVRTERAIQQGNEQPKIQQGGRSSSSTVSNVVGGRSSSSTVRNVVGGIVGGVGSAARGVAGFLNPFSGQSYRSYDHFHTPGEVTPESHRRASPVPSELDEAIADYESDTLNDRFEQESQKSQKTESSRRSLREHLDETHQQQSVLLPLAGGVGSSPASSRSSPAAPTEHYISTSPVPAQSVHSSSRAQSVHSSPAAQSVHSSPAAQSVHSSSRVQSVHSSSRVQSVHSSSQSGASSYSYGPIRSAQLRRQLGY